MAAKVEGIKIFVNGKSQSVSVKNNKLTETIKTTAPFQLAALLCLPFRGWLDDVRIYNRVLKPEEVNTLSGIANLAIVAIPADKRTDDKKLTSRNISARIMP
jgi:hypothetical protein